MMNGGLMKKLGYSILALLMMVPMYGTNHSNRGMAIVTRSSQPKKVLQWFKSLRKPTWQDVQHAKAYLKAKWECLRYGKNCSKKERAALAALMGLVVSSHALGLGVVTYEEVRQSKRRKKKKGLKKARCFR
jgi:hypothetical protein